MLASVALGGCMTVLDYGPPAGSEVQSGDFIVIGRLENTRYEHVDDPDDLLGHGWFYAKLHVKRLERGTLPDQEISVRYFAHTWLRDDVDFRFRLRPGENGEFIICQKPGNSGFICDRNNDQ